MVDEAIELTSRHRLRGYDAVHLACALRLNRVLLGNDFPPLTLVAADEDLLKAAYDEGLKTENPNLHPLCVSWLALGNRKEQGKSDLKPWTSISTNSSPTS